MQVLLHAAPQQLNQMASDRRTVHVFPGASSSRGSDGSSGTWVCGRETLPNTVVGGDTGGLPLTPEGTQKPPASNSCWWGQDTQEQKSTDTQGTEKGAQQSKQGRTQGTQGTWGLECIIARGCRGPPSCPEAQALENSLRGIRENHCAEPQTGPGTHCGPPHRAQRGHPSRDTGLCHRGQQSPGPHPSWHAKGLLLALFHFLFLLFLLEEKWWEAPLGYSYGPTIDSDFSG